MEICMSEKVEVAGWVRLYDGNDPVEEFSHGPEKPREWRDEDCARVVFHADHERAVAQHERIVAGLEARLAEASRLLGVFRKTGWMCMELPWTPELEAFDDDIDAFLAQTAEGS